MTAAVARPETPSIVEISLSDLVESPLNPRTEFDPAYIDELAANITVDGIHEPLIVRPGKRGKFEIGQGHCRFRAAQQAGLATLPCIVREMTDAQFLQMMMSVQQHNRPFTPLDEARGYQRWMQEGKLQIEDVADRIGRSVRSVYNSLSLLNLIPELQSLLRNGRIDVSHAVEMATLKPGEQQRVLDGGLFRAMVGDLFAPHEETAGVELRTPVSVRELRAYIAKHVRFDTSTPALQLRFPDTAATLEEIRSQPIKHRLPIVAITYEASLAPEVKDEAEKIYGPRQWKRADGKHGSRSCTQAVMGYIAAGPGWGDAFVVCTNRKACDVHWAEERKAAAAARVEKGYSDADLESAGAFQQRMMDKAKADAKERTAYESERERWQAARPAILKAIAERLRRMNAGPNGPVAKLLFESIRSHYRISTDADKAVLALMPDARISADSVVRQALFIAIEGESRFDTEVALREYGKRVGLDVGEIVNKVAPQDSTSPKKALRKKSSPRKAPAAKAPAAKKAKAAKKGLAKTKARR